MGLIPNQKKMEMFKLKEKLKIILIHTAHKLQGVDREKRH